MKIKEAFSNEFKKDTMLKILEQGLPKLYSTENINDPKIVIHFFNPLGQGDWYVIEGEQRENDILFYGFVDLLEKEFGYFTLKQLESVRLPFGLKIEKDESWIMKKVSEVI